MRSSLLILSLISTILATSCSVNYHLGKAIKKGYRCEEVADTFVINSIDSIPYVLRDSIMWERVLVQKDTIVRYKVSKVPLTRYQERIRYKLKRDTLRMIEKVEVVKYKTEKHKNKKPNLWLFIIGFVAGFAAKWLMKFAKYTL
jgi:K+ transporter